MALQIIKGMKLNDGSTEFDVSALSNTSLSSISYTSKGNLQIAGPTYGSIVSGKGGKFNLESDRNLCFKPGAAVQFQTQKYRKEDATSSYQPSACYEFRINVINDDNKGTAEGEEEKKDQKNVEGLNINAAGLTFSTKDAHSKTWTTDEGTTYVGKWDASKFPLHFKKKDDAWTKLNCNASAIDLRTRTTGAGTGGGIAVQIASCDDNAKENKFKIETSRIVAPSAGLPSSTSEWGNFYVGEGGMGIEIGTVNSQFESFGTKELRRMSDTDLFATTRSPVLTTYELASSTAIPVAGGTITTKSVGAYSASAGTTAYYANTVYDSAHLAAGAWSLPSGAELKKYDFGTMGDDSKDIKSSSQASVKWIDLINAAIYLKAEGLIPSDGTFLPAVNVTYNLTLVTASGAKSIAKKSAQYQQVLSCAEGQTITTTVTVGGTDVTSSVWDSATKTVTIPSASLTGDVIITASAS